MHSKTEIKNKSKARSNFNTKSKSKARSNFNTNTNTHLVTYDPFKSMELYSSPQYVDSYIHSMDNMMKNLWEMGLRNFDEWEESTNSIQSIQSLQSIRPIRPIHSIQQLSGFIEKSNEFVCEFEIPRDMIETIKITEKDDKISISGNHIIERDESSNGTINKSRSVSSFNHVLNIPTNGVKNSAIAKYVDGKLEIHIQKQAH